jgi:phage shock protein PspC (stress-responsive transcriptional regulator)
MKKVININFQGRVVPIEESAYDLLKQYVDSLRNYFAKEEGKEEIINDIESRIGELFAETLKKGSTCITDDDVNSIINSMGRTEDFDEEENNIKSQLGGEKQSTFSSAQEKNSSTTTQEQRRFYRDENNKVLGGVCSGIANYFVIDPVIVRVIFAIFLFTGFGIFAYLILWIASPSSASKVIGSQRKRLFRDTDDKVIAGVCSGLAQYFNISIWIPRLLFLIPFFSFVFRFGHWAWWNFPHFLSLSFSPGSLFIYIILWLVIPEAKTASDKLEMKGEKVDLNNIKNTIQNDLEGFSKRAEEWGKEVSETLSAKGKQFSTEATTAVKRNSTGLGDIIVIIFKMFAYFILGVILFAIVVALFSLGVVFTGLLPAWQYVLNNGWETVLAWGTLILFIWVPVIGIITYIIRRITGKKGKSNIVRLTFGGLWTLGWVCFIILIASIAQDFKYSNHIEEKNIVLTNPKINKLEIVFPSYAKFYNRRNWLKFEPFATIDEDSIYIPNIKIHIVKSTTDSFSISMLKTASGRTKAEADATADAIQYKISQQDSIITIDKGIALSPSQKFRNQHILLTVYVPLGKKIKINDYIGWNDNIHIGFDNDDDWDWRNYNNQRNESWRSNVEYIMTEKGLKRTDNNEELSNDTNDNNTEDLLNDIQQKKDALQKQKEQKLKELENIDKALQEKVDSNNSKYHYQKEIPKKEAPKKIANVDIYDATFNMHNIIMARLF